MDLRKIILLSIIFLYIISCTEKYNFNISNNNSQIVIESYISNKSYSDTKLYPSDGRYFFVKLSYMGNVDKVQNTVISNAIVNLIDDKGGTWLYAEDVMTKGTYYIYNSDFKAEFGVKYKLSVKLPTDELFESYWETMPEDQTEVGNVSFKEVMNQRYVRKSIDEQVLRVSQAIDIYADMPDNSEKKIKFYRWTFDPIWIYIAPLAIPNSKVKLCYIRDKAYLKNFALQKDLSGSYEKKLFNIETNGNERVYEKFSVLITQQIVSENYFNFWNDLLKQSQKGGLYDYPPFNLTTNYRAINNDLKVNGYFGVITENAYRWHFNKLELSYPLNNNLVELCNIPNSPRPLTDPCRNCMDYSTGQPTTSRPDWWK
jgi:hypothetical protein